MGVVPPKLSVEDARHLKLVSQIKHVILQKYLPPWQSILGSAHKRLCYFDCYAGPGIYELDGNLVDGSPLIALRAASEYVRRRAGQEIVLTFVENDMETRESLEHAIESLGQLPKNVIWDVFSEDAGDFIPSLLGEVHKLAPSFFFVDPYGHPLTVPVLNDILRRKRTEALINFMYYRINMDAGNSVKVHLVDQMFDDNSWRSKSFLNKEAVNREKGFIDYFCSKIDCKYVLPFRVRYGVEDPHPGSRTKYYLIHASNHPSAALLMKQIMWPLGDEEGIFDYSGIKMGTLFSRTPQEDELKRFLLKHYLGKTIGFDDLRIETLELPFIEKHYRAVLKDMEKDGAVAIRRVSSKVRGIKERDQITFHSKLIR